MAITKSTVVDQITVTENCTVLYREVTRVVEDGIEIAKTYHRTSLTPGQDLAGKPAQVFAIAQVAWTPDAIAAYQTKLAEERAKIGAQNV